MRRINNPERYISHREAADCLREIANEIDLRSSIPHKKDELCWIHVQVYSATKVEVEANLERLKKQQERSKEGKTR